TVGREPTGLAVGVRRGPRDEGSAGEALPAPVRATYRLMPIATYEDPKVQAQAIRRRASATWLADHFEDVPLIMVPCQAGRIEGAGVGVQAGFWGSFLPAVWNFMLALRSRGLGSAWVTMNL